MKLLIDKILTKYNFYYVIYLENKKSKKHKSNKINIKTSSQNYLSDANNDNKK